MKSACVYSKWDSDGMKEVEGDYTVFEFSDVLSVRLTTPYKVTCVLITTAPIIQQGKLDIYLVS